jgi:1-acyl-sn-glycerol-3-phosphate acyltransferase
VKRRASAFAYRVLTAFTRMVMFTFSRWEVVHAERVPAEGGVVLAGNHLHLLDPPLVAASCRRRVHPMAKRELFETPLIGWIFWAYGAFPVRRFSADIGALRTARNHLRGGEAVLMFPEGTRSKEGAGMKPALPGTAMVALLAGVPVVPVAITGTEKIRLPGALFLWMRRKRLHIRVEFGEPFDLPSVAAEARHAEETTDLIMRKVAEVLPESFRGAYGAGSEGEVVFARQLREGDTPSD